MIVAKMSKIDVQELVVSKGSQEEKDLQSRLAQDGFSLTFPVLETQEGDLISQSTAICQFIATVGSSPDLNGSSAAEQTSVEQWMTFLQEETQQLAQAVSLNVYGQQKLDMQTHNYLYGLLKENIKVINNSLKQKLWLCGTMNPTCADIMLALATLDLQQCIMDTNTRNSWNNLNPIFKKIVELGEFKSRMGTIKQGKRQIEVAQ